MKNYDLARFVEKQTEYYLSALEELRRGRKRNCWMWFIFPQLRKLGESDVAILYGIEDLAEARAYMDEPYLRGNLIEITRALLGLDTSDPYEIMSRIDGMKLCSCMTLFEIAAPDVPEFGQVLDRFFGGVRDSYTVELLKCGTEM